MYSLLEKSLQVTEDVYESALEEYVSENFEYNFKQLLQKEQ